jgi:hypothetical protein
MRLKIVAVAGVAACLTLSAVPASAQRSTDDAHRTVNRLLNGAQDIVVMRGGKKIDAYFTLSDARTAGRCRTSYKGRVPSHPDIPAQAHGTFGEGEIAWIELSGTRLDGRDFYRRDANGNSINYRFGSSAEAAEFAAAAEVIMRECGSAEKKPGNDQPLEERVFDAGAGSASLAIDRRQGTRYGWAIDYANWHESDERALSECKRNGGNCQVVLRFTGGCGAFAADQAKGSSVYGWGLGTSRQAAENRAWDEARQRGATNLMTRVWGCNSAKALAGTNGTTTGGKASGGAGAAAGTGSSSAGLPGKGKLSEEVIRRNEAAAAAHRAQVQAYQDKLKANADQLRQSVAQRQAVDAAHQRELERAAAAKAEYERQRQAYREEYRRVTGRYPDE